MAEFEYTAFIHASGRDTRSIGSRSVGAPSKTVILTGRVSLFNGTFCGKAARYEAALQQIHGSIIIRNDDHDAPTRLRGIVDVSLRTNIDIDDDLIADVMLKLGVRTKREAVDLALRRVAGPRLTKEDFDAVRGIEFEIDLAELRNDQIGQW